MCAKSNDLNENLTITVRRGKNNAKARMRHTVRNAFGSIVGYYCVPNHVVRRT